MSFIDFILLLLLLLSLTHDFISKSFKKRSKSRFILKGDGIIRSKRTGAKIRKISRSLIHYA